jgi:hypothetical protein
VLVELAIVMPVTMLLLIGLIVGILGVFRFNQISCLAAEGARWASVHGVNYEKRTGDCPIDSNKVLQAVILPRAAGLDVNALQCDLTWNDAKSVVAVKVTYQWLPEAFISAKTLSCTAVSIVSN